MIGSLIVALGIAATMQIAPVATSNRQRSACELLGSEEIHDVQQASLEETKATEDERAGLRLSQCVFVTADFSHSVSLTTITGSAGTPSPSSVREYWDHTFREGGEEGEKKREQAEEGESAPRRIPRTGDDAYWSGDARAGALYVLSGNVILRISAGGVADEDERIRRSQALARAALRRLRKNP